jgi:hypothetical protein
MTDPLMAEAIYLRLGSLIADAPDLKADPTPDTRRWVARVLTLIEAGNLLDTVSIVSFKVASQGLDGV